MLRKSVLFLMVLTFVGVLVASHSFAKDKAPQTIVVIVGSDGHCGSHQGYFDAVYEGRKISVDFYHSPNPANPVEHPVKVFKGKKMVEDWSSLICTAPGDPVPLAGKKVSVEGRWVNKTTFEAYKVFASP